MKTLKQGKLSSSAIAIKSLGAPAIHYRPAPVEEKIIATITKYLVGHETSAAKMWSSVYKVSLSATAPKSMGKVIYTKEVTN